MAVPADPVDVSVLVVSHESRDDTLACLAAFTPTTPAGRRVEVLVLDNASTDATGAAIRANYPAVTVVDQPFRAGFGANINSLLRRAAGRYLYLTNPDAATPPDALDTLAGYLDRHAAVALVAPRVRYPDGRHHPNAYRFPSLVTSLISLVTLGQAGVEQSRGGAPRDVDWAQACAVLVRRAALNDAGGFDEGFFMYAEETDLQRRFADRGWQRHWLPGVVVTHAPGGSTRLVATRRVNEEWRSRRRYWVKHHGNAAAAVCGVLAAAQYALMSVAAAILHRSDAATLRLCARNALVGVRGGGLEELAARYNAERCR